jgi:hypothetical protein
MDEMSIEVHLPEMLQKQIRRTDSAHQEKWDLILHDFTLTYIILSFKTMFLTLENNVSIVKPISAMRT